jgi:thermitase
MIAWFIRDALIFFFTYLLLKFVIRNKILVTVVLVITIGILGYWYYKNGRLPFASSEAKAFETANSAELLLDIKDKNKLPELTKMLDQYKAKLSLAFPQIADTAETELDDYYTVDFENFTDTSVIIEKLIKSGLVDDVEYNETYALSPVEELNATFEKFLVKKDTSTMVQDDTTIVQNADLTIVQTDSAMVQQSDSVIQQIKPMDYKGKSLNDPKISSLWAFNYMEIDKLQIKLKDSKPLKKAKIFILDTGVDAGHEDLAGNYFSLAKEYDTDTDRHGTHCAGIANAVSNNLLGIASLNLTGKLISITSITVLPGGSGRQENIIDGIILAADNEADVISMSLGGASTDKRQSAYEKAIKYANDKGAIIVVAAGNENINAKLAVPASCKGVITVSAIDDKLEKAVFSNYVSDLEYKLSAPGVGILSTTPHNDYQFLSGTSMATPYVAGLIGIMKAFEPKLTTEDVYRILNSTGKETKNTQMTGKLIQPLPAISSIDTKTTQSTIKEYVNKFFTFKPDKN